MAMSTLPSQASSIRTCATRLPPASTTAMFIGWPISVARASPAARTRLASASETVCCSFTSCPSPRCQDMRCSTPTSAVLAVDQAAWFTYRIALRGVGHRQRNPCLHRSILVPSRVVGDGLQELVDHFAFFSLEEDVALDRLLSDGLGHHTLVLGIVVGALTNWRRN